MMPGSTQAPVSNLLTIYSFSDDPVFSLPGGGEAKENCGQYWYMGHISDPGTVHYKRRKQSCHRKDCPVCWKDWQKREALAIMDRLWAYYDLYGRWPVHYVISPPQDVKYDTGKLFRKLRKLSYKMGKMRGIKGGCMVFHERGQRDHGEYFDTHCSNGPHFHILGDGWLTEGPFVRDGWLVKNLKIRSLKDTYNTSYYLLDHTSIIKFEDPDSGYPANSHSSDPLRRQINSITWFGTMSYNKLHIPHFKGSSKIKCEICDKEIDKSEWYRISWCGPGPPPDSDFGAGTSDKSGKNWRIGVLVDSWRF